MNDTNFFRKYIDIINEAPATAINPNDPNAAAFGKNINTPAPQNVASTVQNNPANINQQATAARNRLQQQMASGKVAAPTSNVVDPNAQKGGGYDTSKVQYASGGNPMASPTASSIPPASQPNLASQYITANQPQAATQPTTASVGSKPPATEPSLASQYVAANQPQTVAEEDNDGEDDLLKSIIRLVKQQ